MRRLVTTAVVVIAGGSIATGSVLLAQRPRAQETDAASSGNTATLEVRDLVERDDFAGNLVYGGDTTLVARNAGTLLRLLDEGSVARRGDELFTIEGAVTYLLYGELPMWRDLGSGVSEGRDVAQLERNLVAMGYDPYDAIDIDQEFDAATTAAIERWEDDLGVTEDGIVTVGDVVFASGALRIGEHQATIGAQVGPGTPVTKASSPRQVVAVDLPADRRPIARAGKRVTVQLPGGAEVRGRIAEIGAVARAADEQGGEPTIDLLISLLEPAEGFDQAPVEVTIETSRTEDALSAPVTALLALAEGGYALEVVQGATTALVPVELGAHADGWVEVDGPGLQPGTEVVVAQ